MSLRWPRGGCLICMVISGVGGLASASGMDSPSPFGVAVNGVP